MATLATGPSPVDHTASQPSADTAPICGPTIRTVTRILRKGREPDTGRGLQADIQRTDHLKYTDEGGSAALQKFAPPWSALVVERGSWHSTNNGPHSVTITCGQPAIEVSCNWKRYMSNELVEDRSMPNAVQNDDFSNLGAL
jgi:hypothetical protein